MKRNNIILIFIAIISALVISVYWESINRRMNKYFYSGSSTLPSDSLQAGKHKRHFSFYVPKGLSRHPALVFVLHGSGGTSEDMRIMTGKGFEKYADRNENIIVVYPQGYKGFWNDCRKQIDFETRRENTDELQFFKKMIEYFSDKFRIDTKRVYATGFSNGGQMCIKLAMEMPEYFRAIATVCSNIPEETNDECYQRNVPVSILLLNGTSDPFNLYAGGEVNVGDGFRRGAVWSTDRTLKYWIKLNNCDTNNVKRYNFPDINKEDSSTVTSYTYENKSNGKKVVFVKITGGGHVFPSAGFSGWDRRILGNVNKDIDATKMISRFFNF